MRTRLVTINGRQTELPAVASGRQIQAVGGIDPERRIMQRTRTGNFLVRPDDRLNIDEGSVFIDAPKRVKGHR